MINISFDYMMYGLRFRSAIHLPPSLCLGSCAPTGKPDVTVSLGKTPAKLPNLIAKRTRKPASLGRWEANKDSFLMDVPSVARYLVSGGRQVTVEPRTDNNYKIGIFLTGMLTSALLQQRSIITFHAGGIITEAGAILFPGVSGIGKSSLVAALINRGYSMLSDDLTGVTFDADGRLTALISPPYVRLQADTLDMVGWRERPQMGALRGSEKYRLPVEQVNQTQVPIRAVYILTTSDLSDITVERMPIVDTFKWLYKHTYQRDVMKKWGHHFKLFHVLEAMARTKPTFLVRRPIFPFLLDTLADRLDASLCREILPAGNDAAAGQAASRSVAGG